MAGLEAQDPQRLLEMKRAEQIEKLKKQARKNAGLEGKKKAKKGGHRGLHRNSSGSPDSDA